ncbi:MAG: hypothetical protein QF568_05875 [Flavobacteriales bacterium]|jgi:hypothetical protein|nr:hypothetical protein [Flavobacteriales bacterium]
MAVSILTQLIFTIIVAIIQLTLSALLLMVLSVLFKFKDTTYKTAFKIMLWIILGLHLFSVLFLFITNLKILNILPLIFVILFEIILAIILMKIYYNENLKRTLLIWLVWFVAWLIVRLILSLIISVITIALGYPELIIQVKT